MLIRTSKDKDHPYVLLNKTFLEDPHLSLKAKGLLAYCMSKPDGWKFHVDQMTTVLKEGRDAIYSSFKELISHGYCIRYQSREKGKFNKGEYTLYEIPQKRKEIKIPDKNPHSHPHPHTGFPDSVSSDSVRTTLVNIDNSNNDISKIDIAQTAAPLRKIASPISFSFEHRKFLNVSNSDLSSWKEAYPSIDVSQEIKKMVEWCLSNEKKAKSKRLWRKFITTWLSNANEKSINQQAYRSNLTGIHSSRDSEIFVKNKQFSEGIQNSYTSTYFRIDCLSNQIEIVPIAGQGTVEVIKFSEKGFQEQLQSLLRKKGFRKT